MICLIYNKIFHKMIEEYRIFCNTSVAELVTVVIFQKREHGIFSTMLC